MKRKLAADGINIITIKQNFTLIDNRYTGQSGSRGPLTRVVLSTPRIIFHLSAPAITFLNWLLLMMSSPFVGSSISNKAALVASPKLISTFFFCP